MRHRNKGRKIYKTKEKNYYGKSPIGKIFSAGLTVLLIGGIVFIGYSVAEPLLDLSKRKGDKTDKPANVSDELLQPTEAATSADGGDSAGTAPADTGKKKSDGTVSAFTLRANDLQNVTALNTALGRITKDEAYDYVQVPLKVSGGNIYYASGVYDTYLAGAVQSSITLDEIVTAVKAAGYKPAAYISTFCDHVLPDTFPDTGYKKITDGELWLDNEYDSGGLPWTTPYSSAVQNYLSAIVEETAKAGFERIVCTDFVFPHFSETDLEILDTQLSRTDRYMALTSAANMLYETAASAGSRMMVEVSAVDILAGCADVLQPMLLSANTIVVNIDAESIALGVYDGETLYEFSGSPSEMADKMLGFIDEKLEGLNVVIRLSGASTPTEDLVKAKDVIAGHGYKSYVIG